METFVEMLSKSNKALEGHIELNVNTGDLETTLSVKVSPKFFERFEMACKLEGSNKSKVLRTLIEYFILESEARRTEQDTKMYEMLEADIQTQMDYMMSISEEERNEFMDLKKQLQQNESKERSINKSLKK